LSNTEVFHITKSIFHEGIEPSLFQNYLSFIGLSEVDYNRAAYIEVQLNHKEHICELLFLNESYENITEPLLDDWSAIMGNIKDDKWIGIYTLATLDIH
jgi:hypothetical protein